METRVGRTEIYGHQKSDHAYRFPKPEKERVVKELLR